MPLKKPLPLLVPQRVRNIPRSFAWIDHRLRSEGFLPRLLPEDLGLYLFLVLAADQRGLSCWRLDRIEKALSNFDCHALAEARSRLVELDLIAYRPWRSGDRDGCYQVQQNTGQSHQVDCIPKRKCRTDHLKCKD